MVPEFATLVLHEGFYFSLSLPYPTLTLTLEYGHGDVEPWTVDQWTASA